MDHFNGVTNDDFIAYFLVDLHCRMELTQYTYPHEFMEPQDAMDDHVIRCQNILTDYVRETINEANYEQGIIMKGDEINYIYDQKVAELCPLIQPLIYKYYEDVKVTYIEFNEKGEDNDVE